MRFRGLHAWLPALALAFGCGQGGESTPEAPEEVAPISGLYKVSGETVAVESGHRREIAGSVILLEGEGGDTYTATFSLNTTYPGADQALPAQVIGTGQGTIARRTLSGSADTQLVMATVPGIDPGFAFVPRMLSTRIRSSSTAVVANDGTVLIEIANEGAPGQEYASTRTTLRGQRVGDAGIGGGETANAE